ncbi:hypothetical protein TNCV_4572281 [Trichonephila clavipes]|nr:hypothetical protein TNCV_4572281 [Trichonephila clavipes]
MLIQPVSGQLGLVRGTVVLLENSITVRIREQRKRIEVITNAVRYVEQLYVPNCIKGSWYLHERTQIVPLKYTPDHI